MRELSLHILDIVQNSIAADASLIKINIREDIDKDIYVIKIVDNGHGIEKDRIDQITDPFVTSRKTREVGLGLPLLKEAAKRCDGDLMIKSSTGKSDPGKSEVDKRGAGERDKGKRDREKEDKEKGDKEKGTTLKVYFKHSHLDRPPLGDIVETMISLVSLNPVIDFTYQHRYQNREFVFDTREVKKELDDVDINNPVILKWIKAYLKEGLDELKELRNQKKN